MKAGDKTLERARSPRTRERGRDALADYAILGTPREEQYEAAADLAARLCDAPIGLISFVDQTREWVKAPLGTDLGEVDRQRSFGAVTMADGDLVVPDAAADPRFAGHPWVAHGPRARFYAGVALRTPGGIPIGTVAVLDTEARGDGSELVASLRSATRLVESMLESRREAVLGGALTCVVDFDGRFVRVSPAWEHLLGYPVDELIGRRFLDFVHPDDAQRTAGEVELRKHGDGTRGWENRYVTRTGDVRWLAWHSGSLRDEHLIYAVAEDVTERKQSERRNRLLAENATDMVAQWDPDARLVYLSDAARGLMGYDPEELIGHYGYEQIHPDDHAAVRALHQELVNGTERVRVAFRLRHKDGHWVWTETVGRLLLDDGGKPIGIQTATRDITESKQQMDALQRAEERFRKTFEDAPIGMAIVSLSGKFQRVNRALTEVLAYPEQELVGMGYEDILHPDAFDADAVRALLDGARRSLSVEERLMRRDGTPVWIALSVSLMRDARDERVAFIAQFLDVSERHRAEAESQRAREAAERANRAKSQFLARMSHELRTPLNAIMGFAQLLELDDLTAEQRDSAARIVRGGRHLLEVINDVLDISRIEAGEMAIQLAPVDVGEAVDEAVVLVGPLASERRITVRMDLDARAPRARADAARLRQVLLNLVSNAIKYGPEGSEVVVRTEAGGAGVRIAVTDAGPGIPPDEVTRVFEPFERLDQHSGVEGTGLGLALSRNLVRAMGGEIRVRGSEFTVELEATGALPQPDEPPAAAPRGTLAGTLLYIEERPSNAAFMDRLLEPTDVELLLADDAPSGLALARERQPDAVVLDMSVPGATELLEQLEATSVPVIGLSTDAGAGHLTKPVELNDLMRALREALDSEGTQ